MKKYYAYQLNLRDIGYTDKRIKVSKAVVDKMKELRKKGYSYQKIAEELNSNYATVYRKLNPEYYKKMCKYNYNWAKIHANKEKMNLVAKNFYRYKKEILKNIDTSKYLDKKPDRKTRKKLLMELMESDRKYTYSDLCSLLNVKAPSYFYRFLKQLEQEGKVKIQNHIITKVK